MFRNGPLKKNEMMKSKFGKFQRMEQQNLKNLNTNNYSYLEISGGQSSNPYLNIAHFFHTRVDQNSVVA